MVINVGDNPITNIMHTFKSNSSRQINRQLKPEFHFSWQKSFLDHRVRGEEDLQRRMQYTLENPTYHSEAGFTWVAQLNMNDSLEQLYGELSKHLVNKLQGNTINGIVRRIFGLDGYR